MSPLFFLALSLPAFCAEHLHPERWYQEKVSAGIVLILKDEKRDTPDAVRLGSVISENKLPIKVWLWPRDFSK